MKSKRKNFVASTTMIGVLTMLISVSAFAANTHEDGHLPERNRRELVIIMRSFSVIAGFFTLLHSVPIFIGREWKWQRLQDSRIRGIGQYCRPDMSLHPLALLQLPYHILRETSP